MSALWSAYRMAAPLAGALAPAAGVLAPPAERAVWAERLGRVAHGEPADAWVHAASLGEAVAAQALLRELRARRPGARIQLTATTRTGRDRLAGLDRTVLAPFDTPQAVRGFLDAVRPARLFLIETELWPHWLLAARARGIPVAVLSARLSASSLPRYRWLGRPFLDLVGGLAAVLCQTEPDRSRWVALGSRPERTAVAGNLKFDSLPEPAADRGAARAALGLDPARPLLVLASLRPGEARILANAWRALDPGLGARWQVAAVPRHLAASRELRDEAESAGVRVVDADAPESGAWRWEDRAGVLGSYYAAADVALVGGSLTPHGGHNPLEAAAAGAAVLVGPHHGSQRPAMEVLEAHGAVRVCDPDGLAAALGTLLADEEARGRLARAGRAAAESARGATRRTVDALEEWGLWPGA